MLSKNANFIIDIWFLRDRKWIMFKKSSAKRYKDDWKQKPIINPVNKRIKQQMWRKKISN